MKNILILILLAITMMACEEKDPMILISTEYGDMKVKLYNDTPKHRDNMLKLAEDGYYNETIFHRVISGFMIQGGDPDSRDAAAGARLGTGGPGYTIDAEFQPHYHHKKGALSAARQGDNVNPQKKSSGSQFYVVQGKKYSDAELTKMEQSMGKTMSAERKEAYKTIGGTPFLDDSYTVFGEVVEGLEVIDKIAAVEVNKGMGDRPLKDVKMTVTIIK